MQRLFNFKRKPTSSANEPSIAKRDLREKLKDNYRLIIRNDDSLAVLSSWRMSLINFYLLVTASIFALALLSVILIAYTPLKSFIPGLNEMASYSEIRELTEQVASFERQLQAQQTYNDNLRRLLHADYVTEDDVKSRSEAMNEEVVMIEPIEEDLALRDKVDEGKLLPSETVSLPSSNNAESSISNEDLVPPISGEVSSVFDMAKSHYGIDIVAAKNSPIKSVKAGMVIFSDWTTETGYTITLMHDNDLISTYKHNSALLKNVGERVSAGEAIAIIGNSGELTNGPHLHFELWQKGVPLDPAKYVRFN